MTNNGDPPGRAGVPGAPAGETSEAIIRATVALACEHGMDNISVEQVTRAMGIPTATFFQHFGGILDVLRAYDSVSPSTASQAAVRDATEKDPLRRDLFFCHCEADAALVDQLARLLEAAGCSIWSYSKDSVLGANYLLRTRKAVEAAVAFVVLISPESMESIQMDREIVRAHECGKTFFPILKGIEFSTFCQLKPEWHEAMGAHTAISMDQDGVSSLVPRLIEGLELEKTRCQCHPPKRLFDLAKIGGILTDGPAPVQVPAQAAPPTPHFSADALNNKAGSSRLELTLEAEFDSPVYPALDPEARLLVNLQVTPRLQPQPGPRVQTSAPVDISPILDISGSMQGHNRYALLVQAVRRFITSMGPNQRAGIVLFSRGADSIIPLEGAARLQAEVDQILRRIDGSALLFAGATRLSPGLLAAARMMLAQEPGNRVRRAYVLTDGELHDVDACRQSLGLFLQHKIEVNVYGFGAEFDPEELHGLMHGQYGGTVKPICSEDDIISTFEHVARVAEKTVAQDAVLEVRFHPGVDCGDAWVFSPQREYLKRINDNYLVRELGSLEVDRVYSLLMETRLPPETGPRTEVAVASATWYEGETRHTAQQTFVVPRGDQAASLDGEASASVSRAYAILDALRRPDDKEVELKALRARRDLAILQNQDPALIQALQKKTQVCEGTRPESELSDREVRMAGSRNENSVLFSMTEIRRRAGFAEEDTTTPLSSTPGQNSGLIDVEPMADLSAGAPADTSPRAYPPALAPVAVPPPPPPPSPAPEAGGSWLGKLKTKLFKK